MVDRLIHIDWLLDDLLHLHLLHNHLGDLLLDLDVFWHLDDLLHDPLRTRHISGYLHLHFNRSLNHHFLHCLLGSFPCCFLQGLILHLQPVLLSLETRDGLLVFLTSQIATTEMSQL